MDALALSLLLWISAQSTYDVAALGPPTIRLLSPEAMTSLYYEPSGPGVTAGAPKVDRHVLGFFSWSDAPGGAIYLVRPEDTPGAEHHTDPLDNPLFRERLLHELVHYAQHATGAYPRFACPAQGEFDAYRLGGLYLRQLGVPDPLPGRMVWMRRYSTC